MLNFLRRISATATIRQSSVTMTATLLNGGLGIIFYILAARHLGTSSFGIFSVAIAALTLLSDIGAVGTDTGLVRFVGKYKKSNPAKANQFLKTALLAKLIAWVIIFVIGWICLPLVVNSLLQKQELLIPLRYALLGVGGAMLFAFTSHALQALERFGKWSLLTVSMNALRLIAFSIAAYFGVKNIDSSLLIYLFFPFLGFLIGITLLPRFWKAQYSKEVTHEFFHYNKWVALFTVIAAISSRFDTFLSTRFLTFSQVGIYAVAVTLSSVVPQIIFALATVVAPKLASFTKKSQAILYLKKLQLFVTTLAVLGIAAGITLSYIFIPLLYGSAYINSWLPFCILLIAQAIFLISIPAHSSVFYYFSYPKLFVWVSVLHLLVIIIAGLSLIPVYGATGAAITVLFGSICNFIIPAVWVIIKFRKR